MSFELPENTNIYFMLNAQDVDLAGGTYARVRLTYTEGGVGTYLGEIAEFLVGTDQDSVSTNDLAGKLRVVRTNNEDFEVFYLDSTTEQWISVVQSSVAKWTNNVKIQFVAYHATFGVPVTITFDNFIVNSADGVVCMTSSSSSSTSSSSSSSSSSG